MSEAEGFLILDDKLAGSDFSKLVGKRTSTDVRIATKLARDQEGRVDPRRRARV